MKKLLLIILISMFFGFNIHNSYALEKRINTSGLISAIENSKGKVIILIFWATWCPLCIKELHILKEVRKNYSYKDLKIISVSLDDNPQKIQKVINKIGINFPVFLSESDVLIGFNVVAVPKIYIFNKKNEVVKRQLGYIDRDSIFEILEKLI